MREFEFRLLTSAVESLVHSTDLAILSPVSQVGVWLTRGNSPYTSHRGIEFLDLTEAEMSQMVVPQLVFANYKAVLGVGGLRGAPPVEGMRDIRRACNPKLRRVSEWTAPVPEHIFIPEEWEIVPLLVPARLLQPLAEQAARVGVLSGTPLYECIPTVGLAHVWLPIRRLDHFTADGRPVYVGETETDAARRGL